MGLPALAHYLALEYAGRPATGLSALSPVWLLARHPGLDWPMLAWWPLALVGLAGWLGALAGAWRESRVSSPADRLPE
jgi:hypothetical protein